MTMKQLNAVLKKLAMKNLIKKFKGRSKKENRWIQYCLEASKQVKGSRWGLPGQKSLDNEKILALEETCLEYIESEMTASF